MTLWPRSLGGRLIVILLAVIGLTLGAAALLLVHDQDRAAWQLMHSQASTQAIAMRNLLLALPAAQRPGVIERAGLGEFCYTLTPEPAAGPASSAGEEEFVRRLATRLAGQLDQPPAVSVIDPARLRPQGWSLPPCEPYRERLAPPYPGAKPDHHPRAGLVLSLPLEPGRWLNSHALVVLPDLLPSPTWPVLVLVAVVAAVLVTVRLSLRPLRRLAAAAERLGRGEAVAAVPEHGPSEIVRVVAAFNQMQQRLRRFIDDRTKLLAAISHDLRTPLTTLRLKLSLMDDRDTAEQLQATVGEMQQIVEATLSFVRATSGEAGRRVELTSLVQSVVDDLSELGLAVTLAESPPCPMVCQPAALRRALTNLVDNAVRYGGAAQVAVHQAGGQVRITVDDPGPGIPPGQLEEVVKPFIRLDESRSHETGGIGLGLAIAKTIAHGHGGDLHLSNRPGGGLRAELSLPQRPGER